MEGVGTELHRLISYISKLVTLVALMQEGNKERDQARACRPDLTSRSGGRSISKRPPRKDAERINVRLQYSVTPSSDSEDSRRKRRRSVSSSSEDSSDNEDAETGHWKSKNKYREVQRRRYVPSMASSKVRRILRGSISDFSGNARNWFSKLPRRSIDGFEELRRAFRLNFTQRKKCAKNPVELARSRNSPGDIQYDQSKVAVSANNSYRRSEGRAVLLGTTSSLLLTMTPKDMISRIKKVQTFPIPTTNGTRRSKRGNGVTLDPGEELIKVRGKINKGAEARKTQPRDMADTSICHLYHRDNAGVTDIHSICTLRGRQSADHTVRTFASKDCALPEVKSQLNPATTSLTGFTGEKIWPMGQLRLPVMVGNKEHSTTSLDEFYGDQITICPLQCIIRSQGISSIRARGPNLRLRDA
ncbi:hypothetical protein Tco_0336958 [Tanacetum coccineum]